MRSGRVDVGGGVLAYEVTGRRPDTVLFVHGGFCDRRDWRHQVEGLAGAHRVLTFDLRGHGESTVDVPASCVVEQFAEDLHELLRDVDENDVILVGHSLGCRVILEAAHQSTQRIRGLILVDGSRLGGPAVAGSEQAIAVALREHGTEATLRSLFDRMFVGRVDEDVRSEVFGRLGDLNAEVVTATTTSTVRWDGAALDGALTSNKLPTLAIQSTFTDLDGDRRSLSAVDEMTPWLELLTQRVAHLEIVRVLGGGHFCMLESPAEVTAAIADFATRHAARSPD